jgi:hypothetical protein
MPRNSWKAKAEAGEALLKMLESENKAQKEIIGEQMGELMKLQVVNAGLKERLRLVEIAARGE